MTGGPWYNTSICKKIHGKKIEGFITNARNKRYNIICDIDAHEKLILQNIIMEAAVLFILYNQIQQQKN